MPRAVAQPHPLLPLYKREVTKINFNVILRHAKKTSFLKTVSNVLKCDQKITKMLSNSDLIELFTFWSIIQSTLSSNEDEHLSTPFFDSHVVKSSKRSIVCSPLSALLPLGKLMMGSSSRNHQELKNATGYSRSRVDDNFFEVIDRLTYMNGNVQLSIASRLYVSDKYQLNPAFDAKVKAVFESSCERVDFLRPQKTAELINDWVRQKTKGMINSLVEPNQISITTSLLITNAIYFHGLWKNSFTYQNLEPFKAPGQDINIEMMTTEARFNYTKNHKYAVEIIQIPYSGDEVSFVIVLPFENRNVDTFLCKTLAAPETWNMLFESMVETRLALTIPKFVTSTKLDLNKIYKKVGLKDIFEKDNSVLTKVLSKQKIYVSESIHVAVIEVDEKSSKASATKLISSFSDGNARPRTTEVVVNRPFVYFVVANTEQLFAGFYNGL
ncbi:antichymotrypsin-2-like isoform X2 [Plodia interpunctella]|uniref:antichymotrypsin-2-like isoform X2 n=1 Tax=Plodia interpunctella TaxID=58824 RepID=UPI0023682D1B|nr:antichymotrypsin-2-like isoform X2 [Plodia interpunctella]